MDLIPITFFPEADYGSRGEVVLIYDEVKPQLFSYDETVMVCHLHILPSCLLYLIIYVGGKKKKLTRQAKI